MPNQCGAYLKQTMTGNQVAETNQKLIHTACVKYNTYDNSHTV